MKAPRTTLTVTIAVLFFLLTSLLISAQQLAFPSAKGAGAYATGGRGGKVCIVNTLEWNPPGNYEYDESTDSYSGSFYELFYELEIPSKYIVFEVSGTIEVPSWTQLTFKNKSFKGNMTIAGQTAPGKINFSTDYFQIMDIENVIWRFCSFTQRLDDFGGITGGNGDALTITPEPIIKNGVTYDHYVSNLIFDHCSFFYGRDEGFDISGRADSVGSNGIGAGNPITAVTVQNCFLGGNVKGALLGCWTEADDRVDGIRGNSFLNTAFVDSGYRYPNSACFGDMQIDDVNIYVENPTNRLNAMTGSGKMNILNYYVRYGNRQYAKQRLQFKNNGPASLWSEDHVIVSENGINETGSPDYDHELGIWDIFASSDLPEYDPLPEVVKAPSKFSFIGEAPIELSPYDLYDEVLLKSGNNKRLDENGGVIIDEYPLDTFYKNLASDSEIATADYRYPATLAEKYPSLNSGEPYIDSDKDGMPDAWEILTFSDLSTSANTDSDNDGYTNLEEYLNLVDSEFLGNVEATGVDLTPNVATINVSETLLLNTQFTPVNTTDQTGVWTSENDAIASVDANGLVTGNSEGSVEVRFVSNDGGFTATSQITVIPLPLIANAGDDQTICEGQEIQLTAEEAPSYLWSTGETTQSINVSPIITTTYTLTVTDGNSTEIDEVTVFVDSLPDLTVSEDVSIVEGENIELSATGANTYLWSTGETTSSINVSPLETTTYNVIGTNGVCEVSENVTVTVEPLLNVDLGDDQQICEGSGESIILDAGSGDTYLWNTGETTQTIMVDPVSTSTYSVTVTSGTQQDTDSITIFVEPNPNVVILNGDSVDILNGDFVTLSATGANTYEWNNGATQPNIAVSPSQTTVYEVRGYINECYDEKQVVVNVIPEVEADAGDDVEICLGETVILTATGGDEYAWSNGEITQSIEVSPTETTQYTVTVFNALDFDEDSVVVTVISNCEESIEELDPTINEDEPFDFTFDIFPNPTSNYIDVRIAGIENLARIYIYDMMGKLIYQKRVQNESTNVSSISRFDMSNLIPGIYYVQFQNLEKTLAKKLIVQ
ncbi:Ig-like domain-containing protein [Winogradskyella poriferorum]|uniref:Ig-like domain-containing protein n=1 Tax=Winogradskyella poriferorum TaxID=307627 RepID=UPI003D658765